MNPIIFTSKMDKNDKKRISGERKFWDKTAKVYDDWLESSFKEQYNTIKSKVLLNIKSTDTVLDMATGTGEIAFNIEKACKKLIGIDISPEMIKIANEKRSKLNKTNLTFQVEDAYNLPFPDSSFDKVVCCNALQAMKEPNRAIEEGKRVLKDDGEFISITYCFADSGLIEQFKLFKWVVLYGIPIYWTNFTCKSLVDHFEDANFKTLEDIEVWQKPVILFLRSEKAR